MILGIPSIDTYKQYRELKKTQTPISIKATSPELDDFLYNKQDNFSSAVLLGCVLALDVLLPKHAISKGLTSDKFTRNILSVSNFTFNRRAIYVNIK